MIIVAAVLAVVYLAILMLCLCAVASGADDALARMADRALGPASSDEPAPLLLNTVKQDGGIEMSILAAMDSWQDVPHERRHG